MRRSNITLHFARWSLFLVFFWFGALKLFFSSPANPLVESLLGQTLPFIGFELFIVIFGLFEMLIGILFVIPSKLRLATVLFVLHMFATFLPLILLSDLTWQRIMAPTLEGQYIIKNVVLIALVAMLNHYLHPPRITERK